MSGMRASLLFWFLVLGAVGCGRYYFLARDNGDRQLAAAAIVGFVLICAAAVMELLGILA